MRSVMITGGAGFLGSHLCDYFLDRGFLVWCVDNFLTGRLGNVVHLSYDNRFQLIKKSVLDFRTFDDKIDAILHFASPASPNDYLRYPLETLLCGSQGTLNMLELARSQGAKFLLASTSEIYGDPLHHPQSESYWGNVNPIGQRSVYDEAKRFAEAATMTYRRKYGMRTGIVRIFNTYGSRMRFDDGRVVPTFVSQALAGKPLTVYGDGLQTRSFMHVDDLVRGVGAYYFSDCCDPVNLGCDEEVAILDLARMVIELTGSRSKIVFKSLPKDDPRVRCPDISLAWDALHWMPQVSCRDGLKKLLTSWEW